MLGLGWGEILLLAIIGIFFVGPKQLPAVIKGFAKIRNELSKARDEWVSAIRSDKSLQDIQKSINELKDEVEIDAREIEERARKLEDEINKFSDQKTNIVEDPDYHHSDEESLNEATEIYHPDEKPDGDRS